MKWFYQWRYKRNQILAEKYFGVKSARYAICMDKARGCANKIGLTP